jgi:hypothetical protein
MYLEFVEEVKATNIDELINKFGELKYANKPTK